MTERKPPGVRFETWIDRQVREAMDRGEFDNLPGTGKPIPGIDDPYDEMWWVKQKLRRENVSVLPPTLALREEAEDARHAADHAHSEAQARRIIADINERIRDAIRRPMPGPPLNLTPIDVDAVVEQWRRDHPADEAPTASPAKTAPASARASWWRRAGRQRHSA